MNLNKSFQDDNSSMYIKISDSNQTPMFSQEQDDSINDISIDRSISNNKWTVIIYKYKLI